jgi:DNA polymerase III subunit gamma/tau
LAYVSLYRKWRPQTFEEVIGQEYVTRTLSNSLRNGNLAHAYLFTGPRGTGKTSAARILAKALNCEEGPTPNPCNQCSSCREITDGTSVDVVEIDAASTRGIESIRELREKVIFSPAAARMKVYVLDEAHMLTKEAFNAFLKTLEEPPSHVIFVLATTEPHKMPSTILSRCQRYDFRSVPAPMLAAHLARVAEAEGVKASEGPLRMIARRAKGSVRDALVLLEQAISYGDGIVDEAGVAGFLGLVEDEMLVKLGDCITDGDAAGAVALVEAAYEEGRDLVQFAREAQEHFRRIFLLQHADLGPEDLEVDEGAYAGIRRQAESVHPSRTLHFINSLREAVKEMQTTTAARLVLEGTLIGMARSELDASAEALSARLARLEAEMERLARKRSAEPMPETAPAAPAAKKKPAAAVGPVETAQRETYATDMVAGNDGGEKGPDKAAFSTQLDLGAIRRAWPQVKEKVKERKVTTHAFLLEGKPLQFDEDGLLIVFPPDRSFHRGELEKEDHRKVLEESLEEVLGVPLKVRTGLEEERDAEPRRKASTGRTETRRTRAETKAAAPQEGGKKPQEVAGGEETDTAGGIEGAGLEAARVPDEPDRAGGRAGRETHDMGKVKLVKDVFGAEMIEEIKLNE